MEFAIGGVGLVLSLIMWIHDKSTKLDSRLDAMELHMAAIEKQVVANEGLTRSAIQETDTKYALAVQSLASEVKRSTELLIEQKATEKERQAAHRAEFLSLCEKIDNLLYCNPK